MATAIDRLCVGYRAVAKIRAADKSTRPPISWVVADSPARAPKQRRKVYEHSIRLEEYHE